jgi:peptide/nickel transport system ATP-binding protein
VRINGERALDARGITVQGQRAGRPVTIVEDCDIHVAPGEAVAVVGESGSGKSITMRALLGLLPEGVTADGPATIRGRDLASMTRRERRDVRGADMAYVMQDPFTMLNPLRRVGAQVVEVLRHRGGAGSERRSAAGWREEAVRRLAEVGISDPAVADKFPFQLSGGMRQRVAIAAAIAEGPRLLIADEPTTALDVTTQREILQLLNGLRTSHELGLIIVTHDLAVARSIADRVYVMYAGQVVETASTIEFGVGPRHPYSRALLAADPPADRRVERLQSIAGSVPKPGSRPAGCRFAPRCDFATDECHVSPPDAVVLSETHTVLCRHHAATIPVVQLPTEYQPVAEDGPRTELLVRVRDARRTFGAKVALDGVDLDVYAGESVGIVGESGSGKTTLARSLVGLCAVDSGTVEVAGVDLGGPKVSRSEWEAVRSSVQMAFQDPSSTLNPQRTIGATLREGLRLVSRQDLDDRTRRALEQVGLDASYADRLPAQLSGGERQRVAIARALSRDPQVLVCDEVVSALDVSVQALVLNLLNDLRRELGLTYVFITHDLAVVRQVTDRVYVMRDGSVVESGPTEQILTSPAHDYTRMLLDSVLGPQRPNLVSEKIS